MNKKLNDLLNKIELPEEYYSSFNDAKIEKIIVDEHLRSWEIILNLKTNINVELYNKLTELLTSKINHSYKYIITLIVKEPNYQLFREFFNETLKLIDKTAVFFDIYHDRLLNEEENYYIEVYNKQEEQRIEKKLEQINEYLNKFGFIVNITTKLNLYNSNIIKDEIKKELDTSKKIMKTNIKKQETKVNSVILGIAPKGKITPLREINFEIDNITVEVNVFGIVPSNKKGFNSLTLKVTDFKDSMYARIFVNEESVYEELLGKIKENMWLRINGFVKNNTFYNDFVINARNIEIFDKDTTIVNDDEKIKRVELHAHTLMSQMDGLVSVEKLIKRASYWGHKAIAITDHNTIQTFPEAYKLAKDNNVKMIYGVELAMVDDALDVVFRPDDSPLLENTYVVFDFETTGFNAGGGDSIIEAGAVKLYKGKIIDRFVKLINPGKPISPHITAITKIDDEMVKDAPNEKEVIKEFIEWVGELPMVAHNARFDASFLERAYKEYDLGTYKNPLIDTLQLSRILEPSVSKHSLSALVKRYEIPFDEGAHHRADYDSEATALIFHKMMKILNSKKITTIKEIDELVSKDAIHKFGDMYHITLLVQNKNGLKNLFKLVSYANTKYLHKTPRILRSIIEEHRNGLLIGSSCANGEIFIQAKSKSGEEVADLMNFYDYIEVQPPEVYSYLLDTDDFKNEIDLKDNITKIINIARSKNILVCATGDVHHLDRKDKIYREFIINQKVPGGGRHPLCRDKITNIPSQHFRNTKEMLEDFNFLEEDIRKAIVIENPNNIVELIENFEIIPDTKGIPFSPIIEKSEDLIKEICYTKAHEIYGNPLPEIVEKRLNDELTGIINGGFDAIYLIAQKLVEKSNDDGYTVGSRGSVGSSFVATMLNVTEVNPLPAHYICPNCKKSIFEINGETFSAKYSSGYDLPDRICACGTKFKKEGQDMPFATFLGFNADKVPDIDLNFSGDYQSKAHDYTKVLFGADHVFRAGTIGTVAEKTAFGFVKGFYEDRGITDIKNLEIERLAKGVTGVKRTTGQHPGGIVVVPDFKEIFDFTPYQYPADSNDSNWYTTHFNYHDIEDCLLKLDILGHDNPTYFKMLGDLTGIKEADIPMDDKEVMSLFTSTKALGVTPNEINCNVGCVGLPEFTRFVIGIVEETKPKTFAELVKISGLSHGTDVWNGNAQELVRNEICPFKDVIGCRDEIMTYLINMGLESIVAFKIMELVRKGKALKDKNKWAEYKQIMKDHKIPDWYISSCEKIKYMFPKAHATAYITAAWRIAWFKINRAIEYYCCFFSIRCFQFDLEAMEMGYDKIKERYEDLSSRRFSLSVKEQDILQTLEVALEMTARGYNFAPIDLMKSHSKNFIIDEDKKSLIPPFRALEGLGDTVANNIIEEREKGEFLSIDDLQKRTKLSSTLIEKMRLLGILKDLPESSQLSLFDFI